MVTEGLNQPIIGTDSSRHDISGSFVLVDTSSCSVNGKEEQDANEQTDSDEVEEEFQTPTLDLTDVPFPPPVCAMSSAYILFRSHLPHRS